MLVLFIILVAILIGLGFLNSLVWVVAAVLIFGVVKYGGRGRYRQDDGEYRNYREYRDRQDRWSRRYRRSHQGQWDREDRRHDQDHR